MQILLGAHVTIVKINSISIKIDYIQHFVHQHFDNVIIEKKELYIPASHQNYNYRVFLLKWLYALYVKKTNNEFFELKETLLNRQHKAIKILLAKEITYKIIWNIIDEQSLNVTIEPNNSEIIEMLKSYFQASLHVNKMNSLLYVSTVEEKERLKKFLNLSGIIAINHKHIFNVKQMQGFLHIFDKKKKSLTTPLQKAHTILGSLPNDDANTLKKRYKKLAKKYHPDKVNSKDDESIVLYTKKFQNILQAYEMLLEQVG